MSQPIATIEHEGQTYLDVEQLYGYLLMYQQQLLAKGWPEPAHAVQTIADGLLPLLST